ncbi:argininosuccinate synthase [Pseudobacteriovorax antillogorgiicola]|uniref:Argininosuccinate synthase n=1 Tax=Pseudobacteriovorax antillogorgiicola TaxID=1513793 RepID=A0A1Y6B6F8_9BACT|nr:argininosuccinate synthase [Pseudobacteriovorax antillogorgiicola]TCS58803.1 argininosuccinate synthase [Pseudobacteriovorax antillogorgiicola]SME94535.1 argininosuccinate synthase [Pseudobacteriovorax antillogorgiicola]
MKDDIKKVVLAYSGGLDTSVMARWLKETYDCEVIAFTADVGQGAELEGLEEKALKTGCSQIFIEDLRHEFVKDYVWTALKASAVYEGHYLLGTSVARPVIAKKQIEIAKQVGADAVSHGATGKGNDQVRFELGYYALKPDVKVIAPWRSWPFKSRTDLLNYAAEHDIPVTATHSKPYSTDGNMMHISYEGGILEDPWAAPPEDIFLMTRGIEKTPDQPEEVIITFKSGEPTQINGKELPPVDMLQTLNQIGGLHGIGRVDIVENRFVGMKSRGVYETPGMTILHQAHLALETITLDREVMKLRDSLGTKIAELIYNGFWFSPEFKVIQNMVNDIQEPVSGEVKLKLFKGQVTTLGRRSPQSLYSEALATFEEDNVYNQADAEGFIKLNALRLRMQQDQI